MEKRSMERSASPGLVGLLGLALAVPVATQGCQGSGGEPNAGVDEGHIIAAVARVPTSDANKGNVTVDGDPTNFFTNVDDGTAFASADDATTTVRNHWGTLVSTYAAGYSGFPSGSVTQAAVYYRARADSGVTGTIQMKLYDGATLVATGPARPLSTAYANYSETFSGLSVAAANSLRTEVVLSVPGGTGYVRCTQMWLEIGFQTADAGTGVDGSTGSLDASPSPADAGDAAPRADAGTCTTALKALLPVSDASKGNVTADGNITSFYLDLDDGPAFTRADDAATDIRNHWADSSATYTAGFADSMTGISQVVANFRAQADAGAGATAQIKLFDGTALVGTGPIHPLGATWTNFSDTFAGLEQLRASNLRAQVVLQRTATTGYMRVTQLWLDASSSCSTSCTPTTCAAQGASCGGLADGCGGTLSCGTCAAPATCGGGGTANACGGGATSSGDPIFVGAGDISICGNSANGEAAAKVLDGLFANGANANGVVYTLGDNAYTDGLLSEYQTCYNPTWGRHKARTRPAPGNHERDLSAAGGYFQYYGASAGDPSRGAYYSYDLGKWHIVSLDSFGTSVSSGSVQEQWLRADLAAHPNKCTLAYFHAPRFNSGSSHGSQSFMQPIWQALYDANAEVVLSGHEHVYERFAPQTPSGLLDTTRGIRQFTVGTGGATVYSFGTSIANSEVRYNGSYGVLKLTLHDGSFDWEFLSESGATFTDKGTGTCH